MRKEYGELFVSIALMIISAFPLFDLLSNITNITNISDFSLVVVIVMLIIILISSIIYFISYWTEKFNQLHFKGAGYTVPEIYQVRGLHNSSSLYKITHYSTLGRVWQYLRKGYKQDEKLPFGLVAQQVRAAVTVSGCVSHGFESHMCYIDYQQRLVQFLELNRTINIC